MHGEKEISFQLKALEKLPEELDLKMWHDFNMYR